MLGLWDLYIFGITTVQKNPLSGGLFVVLPSMRAVCFTHSGLTAATHGNRIPYRCFNAYKRTFALCNAANASGRFMRFHFLISSLIRPQLKHCKIAKSSSNHINR
jgi:hypothetical protein